eukprot:TRINITY_DN28443_c2_g1_i1.p2 TRINITY_DN28443_c2_g1~~TRINITY_DN28443_c2_g1_i1.p2  ORF type:complete len:109 (-),score=5.57 TRINITY_DN28443_c2_g1_i1:216-542(-)
MQRIKQWNMFPIVQQCQCNQNATTPNTYGGGKTQQDDAVVPEENLKYVLHKIYVEVVQQQSRHEIWYMYVVWQECVLYWVVKFVYKFVNFFNQTEISVQQMIERQNLY